MEKLEAKGSLAVLVAILVLVLVLGFGGSVSNGETFIVHVSGDMKPPTFPSNGEWYISIIASVKGVSPLGITCPSQIGIAYLYTHVFIGFAAAISPAQSLALSCVPGILSVTQDSALQLHTTRSPDFLGLRFSPSSFNPPSPAWQLSNYGDDVIVGVIDGGIWPEHPSFHDIGLGPVPSRWNGICEPGVICNRKIIGARAFYKGYELLKGPNETSEFKSPRDSNGHGTHTASTAAGRFVDNANLFGYASGNASGMAPKARLSIYKVCWGDGPCFDSDMLAGFDAAINDHVDIISLSLGGIPIAHYQDSIAIGSFSAMEMGILTSAGAGNSGPDPFSVSNIAPWILTVAASSLDRSFVASLTLGDGTILSGSSLFPGTDPVNVNARPFPLVSSTDAAFPSWNTFNASNCLTNSLNPNLVTGKIVFCDKPGIPWVQANNVRMAGAAAAIIPNEGSFGETLLSQAFSVPAAQVGIKAGQALKEYINKAADPTATITFRGTIVNVEPAPTMAAFSSRGPNSIVPTILKPDITAPGVNILAAWTRTAGPTGLADDNRIVDFNINSGTSMACPHITGLAALLIGIYPNWTASAIKSSLMTSSTVLDNTGNPILEDYTSSPSTPFVHGAGHVSPLAAINPGLVYDIGIQDYVDYLCSLDYSSSQLKLFTKGRYACSTTPNLNPRPGDLNYPSFSIVYYQALSPTFTATYSRTLLNVDASACIATYTVQVEAPPGLDVVVQPTVLKFTGLSQKLTYKVTFSASQENNTISDYETSFGSLAWKDGTHVVRSPIAFIRYTG